MSSGFRIDFTAQNTDGQDGGSNILDRLMDKVTAAFKKIERAIGLPNGIAPLDADGLIPAEFLANGFALTPSTLHVTGTSAANTALNISLPAVGGKFHYITSIRLVRSSTLAVVGTAILTQVSSNLPGNPQWAVGNLIAAGQSIVDLDYHPTTPLRSLAPGVVTAIGMVAGGLGVVNSLNVSYYVA